MRIKLAIVGGTGSGKTSLANLLGGEGYDSTGTRPPTRPTNSLRIIEYTVPNVDVRKHLMDVDVQLWEVGGNPRLKAIWPAIQNNLDGVVLVYDVNNEAHIRDSSNLHMNFVTHSNSNISPSQCMILGNVFRGQRDPGRASIIGVTGKVRHITANIDDDSNQLREEFKNFLTGVAQIIYDREKASLMTQFTENPSEKVFSRKLSKKELRYMKRIIKSAPAKPRIKEIKAPSPRHSSIRRKLSGNVRRDSALNFENLDTDDNREGSRKCGKRVEYM